MKTLIIYDSKGTIFLQISGSYVVPQGGLQYLDVEIPTGKQIKGIDITVTPNTVIYEDIPLSETEQLKQKVLEQESALVELASIVGITK